LTEIICYNELRIIHLHCHFPTDEAQQTSVSPGPALSSGSGGQAHVVGRQRGSVGSSTLPTAPDGQITSKKTLALPGAMLGPYFCFIFSINCHLFGPVAGWQEGWEGNNVVGY